MKNRNQKWVVPVLAMTLAGMCIGAGTVLAAGDQSDPLVTLSYLKQTALPAVVEQAQQTAETKKTELTTLFDKKLAEYETQLKQLGGVGDSATYSVVTLTKNQQLKLEVGCEVMLRVGTATVVSATDPGLIDVTTGSNRNNGAVLEKNHLYMATISDRSVKATADSTKLLVRGGYTLA